MVKLVTSDGQNFEINLKTISKSILVKNLVEDLGESDNSIPLSIDSVVFKQVIEWCENHIDDEENISEELRQRSEIKLTDYDKKFSEKSFNELKNLALAANFLEVKPMLEIVCLTLSDKIKEMSDKNDPEEDEKIRKMIKGEL